MNNSRLSPQSENSPFVVDGFSAGPELDSFIDFDLVSPLTSSESLPGKPPLLQPTPPTSSSPSQQQQHHHHHHHQPPQRSSHFSLVGPNQQQHRQQNQHLQPSFAYDLYQQQTGPMPGMYSSASSASSFSSLENLGLDMNLNGVMDGSGMEMTTTSSSSNDQGGNDFLESMEQNSLYNTPPYFFPEANGFSNTQQNQQQTSQSLSNSLSATTTTFSKTLPSNAIPIIPGAVLPATQIGRPYAGMHHDYAVQQQQAILARQKKEAEMKAQQQKMASMPKSKEEVERDLKIQALLQSIKVEPAPIPTDTNQKHLPHIARLRKEEDEMDEDERLLASEEGKKLTSKERRQLRNKVSARAFRSRRKEYISQLESEVEKKTTETITLQQRVAALTSENERLANLTRTLLSTPALQPFLETYAADPSSFTATFNPGSINASVPPSSLMGPGPTDTRTMPKDVNPTSLSSDPSNDAQWPLEYSQPMWMTHSNPTVFAATVPTPSILQDRNGAVITEDDYFNPLIAPGKDAFSWLNFPSPSDGFRNSKNCAEEGKEEDILPEEGCQLLSWAELLNGECGDEYDPDAVVDCPENEYYVPDDLMELYEAECGPTAIPALSTSVASSPMSSRSGSVSGGMDAIDEEPVIKKEVEEFGERDYRKMFLGIAEVIMGERMDLCRSSSSDSAIEGSSRNPFAGSNTVMVGECLVDNRQQKEKEAFKLIPTMEVKKEVQREAVPTVLGGDLSGKLERALEAQFSRVEDVMRRVGARCGL